MADTRVVRAPETSEEDPSSGRAKGWIDIDRETLLPRLGGAAVLAAVILAFPFVFSARSGLFSDTRVFEATLAFIYAIAAISMNQLLGYAGQVSLGHQAFIGVGAFVTANLVGRLGAPFIVGVPAGAASGAVAGFLLGLVALRLRGLYFALVTLAYGFFAENTVFLIQAFTRGGAGLTAPRPAGFVSDRAYYFLVVGIFFALVFLDWRFIKTKAGRAVLAIRENEDVAAVNGINVAGYKLLIFSISGAYAGIAGALFAHWRTTVVSEDFTFDLALIFLLIVVVGGVNSRAGIFVAASIFALLPLVFAGTTFVLFGEQIILPTYVPAIGALLLLLTLIAFPGGVGQQLRPITAWFAGEPFDLDRAKETPDDIGR